MWLLDGLDLIAGRRSATRPGRLRIDAIGGGDFTAIGEHLSGLLLKTTSLQPHERLLDIGCGIGRVAVPMTRYLTSGEYTGFDLSADAVRWCRRSIASRHQNFSFIHSDIFNGHYNPGGKVHPAGYTFPCASESVDVAFMGSVMTHLTPEAVERYLTETARVLKPGGRVLMTFFLLDEETRERSRKGLLVPTFASFPEPWWAVQDGHDPEAAVAYDVTAIERLISDAGLEITGVSRGAWSDHAGSLTYQDAVIARKSNGRCAPR